MLQIVYCRQMNDLFQTTSNWQHLSPYWFFHFDDKTKVAIWYLKAFEPVSVCLRYQKDYFEIHSPKHWAFVQSEFTGHQKMHTWCKRYKVDINDDRNQGFTVYFDEEPSNLDMAIITCASSITENIELTLLFYEINERIKAKSHG